jgi:uncharacterized BrkB/YihY/UPF0761 family membrane protein
MVLKIVDRLFAWLLVLGGLLHAYGSLKSYEAQTPELVWSLAGSFAAILLAAVNLLRADRPSDRTLAWVSFIACLCWVAIALDFGIAIGHFFDPRALYHAFAAFVLALFSLRTILWHV